MKLLRYMSDRLSEPATWRGLAMVATGAGVAIKPDMLEAIIMTGTFVSGAIGVLTPDQKKNDQ